MKKINSLALSLLGLCLGIVLVGCQGGGVASIIRASGVPGEVMLVMDGPDFASPAGMELRKVIEQPDPTLPQEESVLNVTSTVPTASFTDLLRRVRNIVIVRVDKEIYTKCTLHQAYDEWATGQLVLYLNTPSLEELQVYLKEQGENLRGLLVRHELFLLSSVLQESFSQKASNLVDSLFGYQLEVPKDLMSDKVGENFLWMSNAQMRKRRDLLVYSFPYSGKQDLSPKRLIEVRDSVLKANIPGGVEGSYASTAPIDMQVRSVKLSGGVRKELRGSWQMEGGAMMGGPFVQHALLDEANGRVLVVEGFIYNPNERKVQLLRSMEAALYGFRPSSLERFDANEILETTYSKFTSYNKQDN